MSLGDLHLGGEDTPRGWAIRLIERGHSDRFVQIHVERYTGHRYSLERIARIRANDLPKDREYNRSFKPLQDKAGKHDESDGNRFIDLAVEASERLAAALSQYRRRA